LLEKSPAGTGHRVIGSVRDVVCAAEDRSRTPALIAHAHTRIVSLTVTEKGYCHDPATGALNRSHPDIEHDLAHPDAPRSAIGVLVAGMALRRSLRGAPLTVLACDNLPANGRTLQGIAHEYAEMIDRELPQWMQTHVAFPCSMVDRIVPATTTALIAETRAALG